MLVNLNTLVTYVISVIATVSLHKFVLGLIIASVKFTRLRKAVVLTLILLVSYLSHLI
jgi:hypothetical protein